MRKTPPDILITTPESLYLMLSSGVREILATAEAVIVDEIHAVAQTKRGSHLALTLERLDHLVRASGEGSCRATAGRLGESPRRDSRDRRPADRALGDAAAAGADRAVPRRAEAGVRDRRCGADEGARPGDRRAGRGHGRARGARLTPARTGVPADGASRCAHVRSIWPAIYPELLELVQEHTSTIIFVNNRRAAERLAKRLNELANGEGDRRSCRRPSTRGSRRRTPREQRRRPPDPSPALVEIARAHHGSLSHEERTVVEEMLKSGQLPCLVATSSLELGIDMGAVDLVIQVESPKSVSRGLQRVGRAGHSLGEVSQGPDLPQVPRRPARVRGGRPAHARRARSRRR